MKPGKPTLCQTVRGRKNPEAPVGSAFTPTTRGSEAHCLDHLRLPGYFFLICLISSFSPVSLFSYRSWGFEGRNKEPLGMATASIPSIYCNADSYLGVLFCLVLFVFLFFSLFSRWSCFTGLSSCDHTVKFHFVFFFQMLKVNQMLFLMS